VPQVPLFLQPFGAPPSEVEQLVHAIILYVVLLLAQLKFLKRLIGKDSIFRKYITIKIPNPNNYYVLWNLE
jgi:uncharacterized membrane protein